MQCILAANLKEVLGKTGLFRQPFILKVGRSQLRSVLAGAHCVADLSQRSGSHDTSAGRENNCACLPLGAPVPAVDEMLEDVCDRV